MNIDKHNNMKHKYSEFRIQNSEAGQVLLIAVMLLAVTLTVILSVTFSSRTDTQLTKLEEENQKALAAAEAGIEAALKSGTGSAILIGNAGSLPQNGERILPGDEFKGEASVTEDYNKSSFVAPLIQKDEQYTFYMGDYDKNSNSVGASLAQDLTICFGDDNQNTPSAVEITLVKGTIPTLTRYVIDTADRINNAETTTGDSCPDGDFTTAKKITAAAVGGDTKLVLVRVFYNSTKILFSRTANLPSQGKFVSSEATSQTGVSKKVELFQSYPQIPSDFFVTGF